MRAIVIRPTGITVEDLSGWDGIKAVLDGGFLELVPFREDLVGYIDEDGKFKSLPVNEKATEIAQDLLRERDRSLLPGDMINGTMVLCGSKLSERPEEGFVECDTPQDIIDRFKPSRELPAELKAEIEADPLYFVMQGGSDGTLPHTQYWDSYGAWEPEASSYGGKLCRERNISW